jgi:hypothetical protein
MTDEKDEEAKPKPFAEVYEEKLVAGEPQMTFVIDDVIQTLTFPAGEALIDFVFAKSPDNRAVVWRIVMSPGAARTLKAALVENKNILDTPPPVRDKQSRN